MPHAKHGDRVRVHYTGRLPDGSVFDSSVDREPIEFTIGADEVIPGFEQAVVGMAPGEKKTATIPAEDAYGARDEDLLIEVGRDQLPDGLDPKVGDRLQMRQSTGRAMVVTVSAVSETSITLDANHPLAGQDLTFEIELVEIA